MTFIQRFNELNLNNGTTAVTQIYSDSSTKIATTEFVKNLVKYLTYEVDFGNSGHGETKFNVISNLVSINDLVETQLAYLQPIGKDLDEVEMDSFYVLSKANNGSIDLIIKPLNGTVHGKFKFRSKIIKV